MSLKVVSFNTQHCRNFLTGKIDFPFFSETIRQFDADIVGLNEMRDFAPDCENFQAQTAILAKNTGLSHYYFARAIFVKGGGPYGNAILSRYPILRAETVRIPETPVETRVPHGHYEPRCLLKVLIDAPQGPLTVLVTHFGLEEDAQISAVKTVCEELAPEKCILMGDFNLPPESPLLLPIREKLQDAAALFTEEKRSCPSDEPTVKIDYIFTTADMRVKEADIPNIICSDHRPHTATIEY